MRSTTSANVRLRTAQRRHCFRPLPETVPVVLETTRRPASCPDTATGAPIRTRRPRRAVFQPTPHRALSAPRGTNTAVTLHSPESPWPAPRRVVRTAPPLASRTIAGMSLCPGPNGDAAHPAFHLQNCRPRSQQTVLFLLECVVPTSLAPADPQPRQELGSKPLPH